MSSEQEQIRSLAERIARRLSENGAASVAGARRDAANSDSGDTGDLAALRAGLAEIQQRLAHIESHIAHDEACEPETQQSAPLSRDAGARDSSSRKQTSGGAAAAAAATMHPTRSPWLSGTYVPATAHPSQERFGIDEAVSELVDFFESEKTCNVEPGEKPCDHCGACSSRGF